MTARLTDEQAREIEDATGGKVSDLEQIYEDGKRARFCDKELRDNPYPVHSIERRKWYEGWCYANLIRAYNEGQLIP